MTETEQIEDNGSRGGAAFVTFAAGLLIPGLGFVMCDRLRHGVATILGHSLAIVVFAWSRFVLIPVGYWLLLATVVLIRLGTAAYSSRVMWQTYEPGSIGQRWRSIAIFGVAVLAIGITMGTYRDKLWGFETFHIPARPMAHTINEGDYVLVDTWAYRDSGPEFGDIVVFTAPQSGILYVKRVAGLPGESFEVRNGRAVRDGVEMDEPYVFREHPGRSRNWAYSEVEIPSNHYFVMGDNRDNSMDSRYFGPVSADQILGRVVHRYFSTSSEFPTVFDTDSIETTNVTASD